jgi:hypothetical protein
MKKYNAAQQLLISLGGMATLVGGYDGHYYADSQTFKKQKQRPNRLGGFSKALRDADTEKNRQRILNKELQAAIK